MRHFSVFQDDILTVIRRVDENWAEGMLGDKIGIFPISYVEVRKTKELAECKKNILIIIKVVEMQIARIH